MRQTILLMIWISSVPFVGCERGEISGLPVEVFDPEISLACEAGCSASIVEVASEDISDQPGATIGELTTCPVSAVVFRVTADSPAVVHEGRTYHTCCAGCAARLQVELAAAATSPSRWSDLTSSEHEQ